ncbi:MAG: response regulator [Candidatus Dormibacterales bacterium]
MESATDSSPNPELAAALHRLRSVLARLKAELEEAALDGVPPPADLLKADLEEALELLAAAESVIFGTISVLVVDDDARLADLTARGLRRLGFEAEPGTILRPLRPNEVVVFDLGIAHRLRDTERAALRSSRPIVVTGGVDSVSRALAASLDASDYLVKPIELNDLAAAIGRWSKASRRGDH